MKTKKPVFEGKFRLKEHDEVIVLSGKDKGKRGEVKAVDRERGTVVVEGVNIVTRHRKPRSTSQRAVVKQQMGEMQVPMGIDVSKVMLICPNCNKDTRVGSIRTPEGKLVRKCQKCGEMIRGKGES